MITINGVTYRNLQEQVEVNTNDISDLKDKHLYEHLLYVTGKLKDAGEITMVKDKVNTLL